MTLDELITKIMLITQADNNPEVVKEVLTKDLQKFYNGAYVKGQLSVLEGKNV